MIQKGTELRVIDNSGAIKAACIQVYKGYRRRYAKMGDIIKVAIKKTKKKDPNLLKIKKGDMTKAVIVYDKIFLKAFDGCQKSSRANCIVLISDQNKYIGSRIFSPLNSKFRYTKFLRLLAMGGGIIY